MIKFRKVNFQYKNKEDEFAIKNINLDIKAGECVLICGVSGCGKTSICRMINGIIPNYIKGDLSGEIIIKGKSAHELDMVERANFIGSVFQNPKTQFFNNNVESEIAFTSENMGVPSKSIRGQVEKQILDFELEGLRNKLLHQMSGGEKQRVACAAASAMEQKLVVLDEPSSNLDYDSIKKLSLILKKWKEQGKTIIISEHRLYFLKDIVDKVYIIDKGEVKAYFTGEDFSKLLDCKLNEMGLRSLLPMQIKVDIKKSLYLSSIQIKNLEVKYHKNLALNISDFLMKWKGVCAIVGENGAGKSTFINAISGLVKSKKGKIMINDKVYSAKELPKNSYIVSQNVTHQLFADSVYEEIACTQNIKEDEIIRLLKELNLYDKKDMHPMALSGGEKQRLAIAVALAIDKRIIFFDEPTSGLDFYNMQKTARLINELSLQGKMVFVITHDIEFIRSACSHILHIEAGKIKQDFSLEGDYTKQLTNIFERNSYE